MQSGFNAAFLNFVKSLQVPAPGEALICPSSYLPPTSYLLPIRVLLLPSFVSFFFTESKQSGSQASEWERFEQNSGGLNAFHDQFELATSNS